MMSKEEAKIVERVYRKFIEGEEDAFGWDSIDTILEHLAHLSPKQVFIEASVQLMTHKNGKVSCGEKVCDDKCFVLIIIEAVESICKLFVKTGYLPIKNRYILEYYLALGELKMILVSPK